MSYYLFAYTVILSLYVLWVYSYGCLTAYFYLKNSFKQTVGEEGFERSWKDVRQSVIKDASASWWIFLEEYYLVFFPKPEIQEETSEELIQIIK